MYVFVLSVITFTLTVSDTSKHLIEGRRDDSTKWVYIISKASFILSIPRGVGVGVGGVLELMLLFFLNSGTKDSLR